MNIALFASGSSGNCALVSDGETHILIDAGISARRICAGLTAQDVAPADLAGGSGGGVGDAATYRIPEL